jgi:integrase/recombinase XerD
MGIRQHFKAYMRGYRPIKRLIRTSKKGEGKAEVATKKQLRNILWQSSRGSLGKRNVAIIWMLFGSGCRINEVAKFKVSDLIRETNELRTTFIIKGSYTKTGKPRAAYILYRSHRVAIEAWIDELIEEGVGQSGEEFYRGLRKDYPLFSITKKGRYWRKMAFRDKKYKDAEGNIKTTRVCGSLQNLISELFKNAGLHGGSSHSGRRTLATWLDHKGIDLEIIQRILGHEDPNMTLEYIDPNFDRIQIAFDKTLININ